jgi:hypothetical protein
MYAPEPHQLLRSSKESTWISCSWTLREAIMSQRCLFFTDQQVSLVCQTSHQTDSISQLTSHSTWGSNGTILATILHTAAEASLSYDDIANHYQGRQLSYDTDALDAFKDLLSMASTQSYYGILLPRSPVDNLNSEVEFAFGLLWYKEARGLVHEQMRADFRSWSWLSRKGNSIEFDFVGEAKASSAEPHSLYGDDEGEVYQRPSERSFTLWRNLIGATLP